MGVTRLSLRVGGVGFVLTTADPVLQLTVDEPTRRFLGPEGEDAYRLDVRVDKLAGERDGKAVFDCGDSWRLSRSDAGWIFDFFTPVNGERPYRRARLVGDTLSGEIVFDAGYLGRVSEVDALHYPLAELLVIRRLAASGGVELHACGLVDEDGRGILLAGRSGDGKTTSANLWSGERRITILSDDRIIVRSGEGAFRMFGTPWHGEAGFAVNAEAPVAAIFLLEHGSASVAVPVSAEAAVASMIPRCFPPFYDRAGVERVLESLSVLALSVPCFRLPFMPDRTAVEAVRQAIAGVR